MSDMSTNRISVRLPRSLTERLRNRSRATGATESELVREALEGYLRRRSEGRSAYELAVQAGVIGVAKDAPKDLSANRHRFRGFGKAK